MSLPGNLIKAGAGLLLAVGAATVAVVMKPHVEKAVDDLNKLWAGKRVAVLGRQMVGKTTLLGFLMGKDAPVNSKMTVDPAKGGTFELRIGKKATRFRVRHDQPGWAPENSYKGWKEDFDDADFVLYLFRADLVEQGDIQTINLVQEDLNQFKRWLPKWGSKTPAPKIVLIGTWADQSPSFNEDAAKFASLIRKSHPIKLGATKLNKADLVVGSLSTDKDRERLIESLRSYIR